MLLHCLYAMLLTGGVYGGSSPALDNVRAFQSPATSPDAFAWPELDEPEVSGKPPHALLISGGGSRSYMAATGALRALTDLGVMPRFRYIGGASGGGWISTAYTFFQANATVESCGRTRTAAADDETLLGPLIEPADITAGALESVASGCLRGATSDIGGVPERALLEQAGRLKRAYVASIHDIYLAPAGIPPPFAHGGPALFSLSEATAADAKERNPGLAGYNFTIPAPGRPFLTIGASLQGPEALVPFNRTGRAYTTLEVNPLFAGTSPSPVEINYTSSEPWRQPQRRLIGGLIEPFAFGSRDAGARLAAQQARGTLSGLSLPEEPFTLSHAAATGGFAPEDSISSQLSVLAPLANRLVGINREYWSPVTGAGPGASFVLGDAGTSENLHLLSLLRREELTSFVLMTITSVPMRGSASWDPADGDVRYEDIDDTIPNYFGIDPDKPTSEYVYGRDHVFERDQFVPFVKAMQASADAGNGIVVTQELRLVDNPFWGIRGGRSVNVTWLYLSRAFNWEAQLPEFLRPVVVPSGPNTTENVIDKSSPYPMFPNIPTSVLGLSKAQANLLAFQVGWVVQNNAEQFCRAVGQSLAGTGRCG